MTRTTSRRRLGGLASLVAIPMLVIGLAACSSAGSPTDSDTQTPAAGTQTRAEWQLAFAECMRENGVDMQDPGSNGTVSIGGPGVDQSAMQAASQTCLGELGQPPAPTEADQKAAQAQYLAWARTIAQCYRDNGYDMPDPVAGEQLQYPSDVSDSVVQTCGGGSNVAGPVSG